MEASQSSSSNAVILDDLSINSHGIVVEESAIDYVFRAFLSPIEDGTYPILTSRSLFDSYDFKDFTKSGQVKQESRDKRI